MKRLTTTLKFSPVVKPVKPVKRSTPVKRGWREVSLHDALNISLRYGFRAVAWGRW